MLVKAVEGLEPKEQSELIASLLADYAKVKQALSTPKKTQKVSVKTAKGTYSYSYSPLDEVFKEIDKAIKDSKASISYSFDTLIEPGRAGTQVYILGKGAWLEFTPVLLPVPKADAQGYGSAITYARRYAISSAFGIASEEDDDAQSISNQPIRKQAPRQVASRTAQPQTTNQDKAKEIAKEATAKLVDFESMQTDLLTLYKDAAQKGAGSAESIRIHELMKGDADIKRLVTSIRAYGADKL